MFDNDFNTENNDYYTPNFYMILYNKICKICKHV